MRHFFCWFNLLASGSCTSSLHFNSSIPFVTSFLSFRLFCSSLRLLHFVRCCCRFKSSIPFVTSSFRFNSSMLRVDVRPEAYTSSWDEWTWPLDNHCVDLIDNIHTFQTSKVWPFDLWLQTEKINVRLSSFLILRFLKRNCRFRWVSFETHRKMRSLQVRSLVQAWLFTVVSIFLRPVRNLFLSFQLVRFFRYYLTRFKSSTPLVTFRSFQVFHFPRYFLPVVPIRFLDPGLKHQACGQVQRKILERSIKCVHNCKRRSWNAGWSVQMQVQPSIKRVRIGKENPRT